MLQSLLSIRLRQVIYLEVDARPLWNVPGALKNVPITIDNILRLDKKPLKSVTKLTGITYVSAIALRLAAVFQVSVTELATALTRSWNQSSILDGPWIESPLLTQVLPNVTATCRQSGYLQFHVEATGLSAWLQFLIAELPHLVDPFMGQVSQQPPSAPATVHHNCDQAFTLQYAHARCCSLLRLAHESGLIQLQTTQPDTPHWQLVQPDPIPWLNGNSLQLIAAAEQHLLIEIVATLDTLFSESQASEPNIYWHLGDRLSQAFQSFYRACRVLGEVKANSPELAQSRLGLVLITQTCLRLILHRLNLSAPLSL